MKANRRFPDDILAAIDKSKILGLRAGAQPHRFIGVWVVVVNKKVFVRSWNDKPQGWYRVFLEEPHGMIQIAGREIRVRTRKTRGERLMDAIDLAYREKYPTPGSRKYFEIPSDILQALRANEQTSNQPRHASHLRCRRWVLS